MSTFRTTRPAHRAALLASAIALPVLLGACASGGANKGGPTVRGTALPTVTAAPTGDTRCLAHELSASVGRPDAGAGQRNFPVVLTNDSTRTCTLRGYPGAAFVDAAGEQLGPDPKPSAATRLTTVRLATGESAWAGLSFADPELSGAETATPAELLVTPPDERDQLKVTWEKGAVPVGGDEAAMFLTVFGPGTGP
ncbi:DUF4232 domain-containing protein [Streptomyces turgidiscabies]|uniref:Putative lipoprotein n=1 Tax=Streptomyces turgidiscabies (strain Car8) TaxID=698760 RepID=L7F6R8_STRT8|nr:MULTISPECIES: DUF4232 domain-containing protein [Streptomyces]ELP66814.1 putative lipoprotein [Streptomyces turgidiscabies Car8]MDX3491824.1 DUF4232 domain-containing protein [Streptomyces turgidiscabies]GAQ72060.1 hypothetical protein T45_03805 [Streptomyces turgidiscabies]